MYSGLLSFFILNSCKVKFGREALVLGWIFQTLCLSFQLFRTSEALVGFVITNIRFSPSIGVSSCSCFSSHCLISISWACCFEFCFTLFANLVTASFAALSGEVWFLKFPSESLCLFLNGIKLLVVSCSSTNWSRVLSVFLSVHHWALSSLISIYSSSSNLVKPPLKTLLGGTSYSRLPSGGAFFGW